MLVQHQFKRDEFKYVRGLISLHAMNTLWIESKRIGLVGVDVIACGCCIRRTHGLPCAREIAEYQRDNRPIPSECIDTQWRKLDLISVPLKDEDELVCDAEIELIMKRFKENNKTTKLHILKKLKELANPETTSLLEPEVNQRTRGRPRMKIDKSTRRDPSGYEYLNSVQDSTSPSLTPISKSLIKRSPKKRSARKHTSKKQV